MTKDSNAATALDEFICRKAEIDKLLARLTEASADHFGADPEKVHWGDVGTLGFVRTQLREIAQHLGIEA